MPARNQPFKSRNISSRRIPSHGLHLNITEPPTEMETGTNTVKGKIVNARNKCRGTHPVNYSEFATLHNLLQD
jgi:hypothetical protein